MANTKTHPGAFRCYEAALPDEPMFVILGRDPAGPATLEFWASERIRQKKTQEPDDQDRIKAALDEAVDMADWRQNNLNPFSDGIPTWKTPRQIMDDDAPVRTPTAATGDLDFLGVYKENAIYVTKICPDTIREEMKQRIENPLIRAPDVSLTRGGRRYAFSADEAAQTMIEVSEDEEEVSLADLIYAYQHPPVPQVAVYAEGLFKVPGCTEPQSMTQIAETYAKVALAQKTPVADSAPDDLAHAPEVPHHRFSVFHKSGNYAYARGLEVNPQHLPTALDAMAQSGWFVIAIFGQTDSQHIGFIFERRDQPEIPSMKFLIDGLDAETTLYKKAEWGGHTRRIGDPIAYLKMKMRMWHPDDCSGFLVAEKATNQRHYWHTASVASVLRLIQALKVQDEVWLLSKMSPEAYDKAIQSAYPPVYLRPRAGQTNTEVMDAYKEGRPLEEIAEMVSGIEMRAHIHISGADGHSRTALAKQLERLIVSYPSHEKFRLSIGSDQKEALPLNKYAYVDFTHEGDPATGAHKLTSRRTLWPCAPAESGCADWVDGEGQRP